MAGLAGATAVSGVPLYAQAGVASASTEPELPAYARRMRHRSLRSSSYDRTGGNVDSVPIEPGGSRTLLESDGPGIVTHIWCTIASPSPDQLKELVLRIYWDGSAKPSVETPIGDFFGLNLNNYFLYQSAFLNCSSVKALNSYFAMPFKRSARITCTNDGKRKVDALYYNIDYKLVPSLPQDSMYFHAQYRQSAPERAVTFAPGQPEINLNGKYNHVFAEVRGTGHLMGVTFGVLQNREYWMGEGDEMIFIDDESEPVITGTGTEDYINGAWDFGGRDGSVPFGYLYNGAPYIWNPEHTSGRTNMYRWHADNPVTFTRYLKHTIEHGHANDRGDNIYSVCYWYQTEPNTDFPPLPALADRIPQLKA